MNNPKYRELLPDNYEELVKKYRKVVPPALNADQSVAKRIGQKPRNVTSGLSPYTGEWSEQKAAHLLKRTLFGVKKSELKEAISLGLNATVTKLLTVGEVPAPPINDYNSTEEGVEDPEVPFGETWINAAQDDKIEGNRVISLKGWMVKNRINQSLSLEEKMILFWHNLLPVEMWGVFIGKASYKYCEMLRRNVFGNYRTLIKELTLDPSMLLYLNGAFNNKYAPDENYGRELQELFCIGKGKGSAYTEADVQAAARVLTGFTIKWKEEVKSQGEVKSYFFPELHDTSTKMFSSFYGNKIIVGRLGSQGAAELDELLDMLFSNEELSRYICRRLYNFFIFPEIDDATEANVIEPLAAIFRSNNYEVKPVLEALFKSEHFFDDANIGSMIKSPVDAVLGNWRTMDVKLVPDSDLYLTYRQNTSLLWTMASQGMELGDPPSVSGWPAYYQAPQYDKSWITTDSITTRAIATDSLLLWGYWIKDGEQRPADLIKFLETLDNPEDPNKMLREISRLVHGITPTDEAFNGLKSILLGGQSTDGYWTTAWLSYQSDPENQTKKDVVLKQLKPTLQKLFQLGESQLM